MLWERKLPEGYLVHRSAFVATKDTFYLIDGASCLLLDPQTGEEQGRIRIPGVNGAWKWMVLKNGILYVLAGQKGPGVLTTKGDRSFGGWSWSDLSKGYYSKPRIPGGFGETLAAYDLREKKSFGNTRRKNRSTPARCRWATTGSFSTVLRSICAAWKRRPKKSCGPTTTRISWI